MRLRFVSLLVAVLLASAARAQTTLSGASLVLKSGGTTTLGSNGYLGTYVVVPAGGATVNFTLNASEGAGSPVVPHTNLVIADSSFGFSVGSTSATNYTTGNISLPAGTYFVRNERDYSGNTSTAGSFTVNSLSVNTVNGSAATFSNSSTDANALAAANTYISNFRKGPATVNLTGPANIPLLAGTPVPVDMVRNAFNFGGTVSGTSTADPKYMLASNPPANSEAAQFQSFTNQYFNTIVPSNAGKWAYNEPTQGGSITMQTVDAMLNYAQAHNMRARMHNLIWGSGSMSGNQQPTWVNTLISGAASGNTGSATSLRNAIGTPTSGRINYYVGSSGNRATKYIEIDVLNEAQHNPSYWNIYGNSPGAGSMSIASIYNDVASAAAAAGNPNLRRYINEYNVYQFSPSTISTAGVQSGSDQYANWYRNQAEAIRNIGGALNGIGGQEYVDLTQTGSNAHSAATIQKAIQNLSVEGLPITMAEFGLAGSTTAANRDSLGPAALDSAVRMFYGNPLATTFMMWGWWDTSGNTPPAQMIVTTPGSSTYTLTTFGQKWVDLMNEFSTHTTANVDAGGNITFTGFYGDYNIGSQSGFSNLNLAKGTTGYNLSLAAPPTWSFWNTSTTGSWSAGANWSSGGVPNAVGRTAYFGPAASARSVNVDTAQTVGMIALNSSAGYTFNGPATISLDGSAGAAAIYVASGSHQINAPLLLNDDTTITVLSAGSALTITNLQPTAAAITKAGAGALVVNNVRADALAINGGSVKILANGTDSGVSNVNSLSIAGSSNAWIAKLDLNDNSAILDYSGASPIATIQNQIKTAFASATWTGNGITSSAAMSVAADSSNIHKTAIGFAEASDLGINSFAGQSVDSTALIIRYTFGGDANLDTTVDSVDFNLLAASFSQPNRNWYDGDFNYDGAVDTLDFNGLAANFGEMLSAPGASVGATVPEPVNAILISIGFVFSACSRRARSPFPAH